MNTFNPMQMMNNLIPQRAYMPNNTPINQQQFISAAPNLSKQQLSQLVMQARAQGISEDAIEQGLNFLLSFK